MSVKICQTCGDSGFSKVLIYYTECWATVEHIYCLGLSSEDIGEGFSWTCDSCASKDRQPAKMVIYGDKLDKKVKSAGQLPPSENLASRRPVVGPIWRGGFEITGSFYGKLDGLEGFMPKTSYSEIVKVLESIQPILHFSMKKRQELWPKKFGELGAAHDNIGIYVFPEVSRSKKDYDNLVEHMISNDLAMTTDIGGINLIIFTSLEQQAAGRHKIQGKYYLWGMFKRKYRKRDKSAKFSKASIAEKSIRGGQEAVGISSQTPSLGNIGSGIKLRIVSKRTRLEASIVKATGFKSKQAVNHKKRNTTSLECDITPFWRPECKRARSKRRRISPEEAHARISCIIGPSEIIRSDQPREPKTCGIVESLAGDEVHDEVCQAECLYEVSVEMEPSHSVTNELYNMSSTSRDGITILTRGEKESSALGTCDTNERQKAYEVDDRSVHQAIKVNETTSDKLVAQVECAEIAHNCILSKTMEAEQSNWESDMEIDEPSTCKAASPSEDFLLHHDAKTICDILRSPNIRSRIDADINDNETTLDKLVTQVECAEITQNCILSETMEAEQSNWESDMEIDEPSSCGGQETQTDFLLKITVNDCDDNIEVKAGKQHGASVGLMPLVSEDQPEPCAVSLPIRLPEWPELQPHRSSVSQITNPGDDTCLIPLLEFEEESAKVEPNLASNEEINLCSSDEPASIVFACVVTGHHNDIEEKAPRVDEISTCHGFKPLVPLEAPLPLAVLPPTAVLELPEPQSQRRNVFQATDPVNGTCLTPLFDYKEESEEQEPYPSACGDTSPCSDGKPLGILSTDVFADREYVEYKALEVNETCAGLYQLAPMEDQLEMCATETVLETSPEQTNSRPGCQASNLYEDGTCRTPLLDLEEEPRAPTCSSTDTCVLPEISDEETTLCVTSEIKDTSSIFTSTSILKMADNYYETSSDVVLTQVGRYMIKSDLAPILAKILDKHGDIALGCTTTPQILLQNICKVYQDLESVPFSCLRRHHVDNLKNVCQLGEALGINVKWLSKHCDDLEQIALQISQYPSLKSDMVRCNKDIESREQKLNSKRATLVKLQEDIKSMEGELKLVKEHDEKLQCEIKSMRSVSQRFLGRSLVDGLF